MALIILILAVVGALTLAGIVLLVIVITGIRASERRMNLNRTPKTGAEKLASRMLGAQEVTTK
jgi:hypothetical protein